MLYVGFEHMILDFERAKTVLILDGNHLYGWELYFQSKILLGFQLGLLDERSVNKCH